MGCDGVEKLSVSIAQNSILTALNLAENHIGSTGLKRLSRVLATNGTLRHLSLRCNKIGPDGATALAQALHTNRSLTFINMRENQVGAAGAEFEAALHGNETLLQLDLRSSGVAAKILKMVQQLTHKNQFKPLIGRIERLGADPGSDGGNMDMLLEWDADGAGV